MIKKYESFMAGFTDILKFHKREDLIGEGTNFEHPNEDNGELDMVEFLRGSVAALSHLLKGEK